MVVGVLATMADAYASMTRGPFTERSATNSLQSTGTAALAGGGVEDVVVDGGQKVAEVTESWEYEKTFSQPVCQVDAQGRVTRYTVDSSGVDPRDGGLAGAGTGLRLSTVRFATAVGPGTGCEVATPASTPEDIATSQRYCLVNGACVPGAVRGDLVQSLDGESRVTAVQSYDAYGNAQVTRKESGLGTAFVVTRVHDNRSRLRAETDTLGHKTSWDYDGLDRMTLVVRSNTRAVAGVPKSADQTQALTYFPGGQTKTQSNGLGLSRTTQLDGLNRPEVVTEEGGGLSAPLVTRHAYDEAGVLPQRSITPRRPLREPKSEGRVA